MPTVTVFRDLLFERLGQTFSDEKFDVLCFQFGIELDEITTDPNDPTGRIQYKIDIPANRYDLLCIEGISDALKIFLQKKKIDRYRALLPLEPINMTVKSSTASVRPYVVTAVLRGVTLDKNAYDNLIDLQEKLHHNICRKRSLVSVGIHNLDSLTPPFVYSAEPPEEIKFIPLNQSKEFRADELMEFYKNDTHLKPYLHIIKDKPNYPIIRDSEGVVLSLPPIINGDHSKLSIDTKNIYIEATATDKNKAEIVLDILVTMLSQYSKVGIEATCVTYEETGKSELWPALQYREEKINVANVNKSIGISLKADVMATNLCRMGLESKVDKEGQDIIVEIPPTRHDIIHACDIIEDVAISYGYDNIQMELPKMSTIGMQFPLNKFTDQLRENIAEAGFTEALTFSLCSIEDECEKVRHSSAKKESSLVKIANPKTLEFQTARNSLLSGLLKTIHANKKMPLPIKIFEISDVVLVDPSNDTGTKNQRRLCAVYYNKTPGFEIIHGLLDRVMTVLEKKFNPEGKLGYSIVAAEDPTYFDGRCAEIILNGNQKIGKIGVLHPEVIDNFDLNLPASALEINIEPFL